MPHSKRDERTANDRSFARTVGHRGAYRSGWLSRALVVGVASLSVMMGMIGDIDGMGWPRQSSTRSRSRR